MSDTHRTQFECADPILRVEDMLTAVRYYVDVLGFESSSWGDDNFTCVSRDSAGIYLCKGGQGHTGSWAWIGVEDVEKLYEELKANGAKIRHAPRNYPWALEIHVEDLDGNVLRMGSEPKTDRPYEDWMP
jgi:predicted enzyme related to lactoylglutathione lyase